MKVKQAHVVMRDNGDLAQVIEATEDILERKGKYYNAASRYYWVAGLTLVEISATAFTEWAARINKTKRIDHA